MKSMLDFMELIRRYQAKFECQPFEPQHMRWWQCDIAVLLMLFADKTGIEIPERAQRWLNPIYPPGVMT